MMFPLRSVSTRRLLHPLSYCYNHDHHMYPNKHPEPNMEGHDHRVPLTPQNYLMSDLLEESSPQGLSNLRREKNVRLRDEEYEASITAYPQGKVSRLMYKGGVLSLTGTEYEFIPQKNVFKLLNHHRP